MSSCRPLRSVPGHDLGNRAAKLGRTTFMFFAFVSFTSCRTPPPSGPGAFWDFVPLGMWHRIVLLFFSFSAVQFLLAPLAAVVALLWVFVFPPTRFRPAPPLPGDMAVVFLDVFSVPYGWASFLSLCTWRSLSASWPRRSELWGWGFEEPHLSSTHMTCTCSWNRVSANFPIFLHIRLIRVD